MGLSVLLRTENGEPVDWAEQIDDVQNRLHRLLPSLDEADFQCLRFIDSYGDTVFNWLQQDQFLLEWARLFDRAESAEDRELLASIEALARRQKEHVHTYLWFIGD